MTEAEWLTCAEPERMLELLRDRASDRKLRLFACACCRRVSELVPDPECHRAIDFLQRYAEGQASPSELKAVRDRLELDVPWVYPHNYPLFYALNARTAFGTAEAASDEGVCWFGERGTKDW